MSGASSKSALDVETQVNQLHLEAEKQATQAKGLSVPAEMDAAQRDLLLVLDLRTEGVEKVANLLRTALGGQAKQASTLIAGDMENFLASDVIYSQRVAPLIEQTLKSAGVGGQTVAELALPAEHRVAGTEHGALTHHRAAGELRPERAPRPGSHGSALIGVSVGANTLASEPTLNHISGGSQPDLHGQVENSGENPETNVKVNVTVTARR